MGENMEEIEKIKVFIKTEKGKTVCICKDNYCGGDCQQDIVTRDRYRDWQKMFHRDKYGRSHEDNQD